MPPSATGNASRQSRRPSPSATRGDGDRVQALARASGGAATASRCTIASSGRSSRVERRAIPRRSASACATDGGPAKAATAVSSRPSSSSSRRRSPQGAARSGEAASVATCRSDGLLVRVAAKAAEQARRVEHERGADHRHARARARARAASASCQPRLRRRLDAASRRRRRAERLRAAGAEQRARAAVQDGLGRGHADDEVGLGEAPVDAQRRAADVAELDEVVRLGVVHLDPAVEAARVPRARRGPRARAARRAG